MKVKPKIDAENNVLIILLKEIKMIKYSKWQPKKTGSSICSKFLPDGIWQK